MKPFSIFFAVIWTVVLLISHALSVPFSLPIAYYLGGLAVCYFIAGVTFVDQRVSVPVLRYGKYVTTLSGGFAWLEPLTTRLDDPITNTDEVDELTIEGIPTHDNVPVAFTLLVTTVIPRDAVKKFFLGVSDGYDAVNAKAIASITQLVSHKDLNNLLQNREDLYTEAIKLLQSKINDWGVVVKAIEITDLKISDPEIQTAISLKARATKEAEAELARAEYQLRINEKLDEAAAVLTPDAWRLKNIEMLLEMTRSAQLTTIVVPTEALLGAVSPLLNKTLRS